ncbi:MAG: CBS domain-containing protein [Candidatus Woesearchaeota archaeon]
MKTGVSVMDAMTKHPVTITKETTIQQCAQQMKQHDVGSLLIVEHGTFIGIVTEQDIVYRAVAQHIDTATTPAKDIMSSTIYTIGPDVDLYDALVHMRDASIRQLPIVQDGKLLGYLTLKDVLKIQPDLFDLLVEHIELREEERKLGIQSDTF